MTTTARSRAVLVAVLLVALVLGAAALVTSLSGRPSRPLDPDSAQPDGARALARLLTARGTDVRRITGLDAAPAGGTVVVAFPDDYRADQLRALATGRRLVLLDPSPVSLAAVAPDAEVEAAEPTAGPVEPGCAVPAATAAGPVDFPGGTRRASGVATCYGGRAVISGALVVFGSAALVHNDELAGVGIAALALNAISDDGAVTQVAWLLPGADARGGGASIWAVLPGWMPAAVTWCAVLALLVIWWRARRLGPVAVEPLPVVVRAAETIEGHGRLYRRGGARDRAAGALRAAAVRRLADEHGLAPTASAAAVAAVVADRTGQPADALRELLDGPAPADDAALVALAQALDSVHPGGPVASTPASGRTPSREGSGGRVG